MLPLRAAGASADMGAWTVGGDRPEKREGHSGALFPLVSMGFFPRCELCQLLLSSGAASPPMLVACHYMSAVNS